MGISFLEATFSASGARAQHRYHQAAARSVLRALLPDGGTNIKGRMRSRGELLAASGYARRGEDFAELLRILDTELRLISPADPAGTDSDDQPNDPDNNAHGTTSASAPSPQGRGQGEGVSVAADEQYFQLTHDYLVPSVREWLAREQKETRRGRAELKLGERTAWWKAKPEKRLLPSGWEWLSIRLLTRPRNWTEPQRQMMRAAGRHHLLRALALAVVVAILGWGAVEGFGTLRAAALVRMLESAETGEVPEIVTELQSYRRWADGRLRELAAEGPQDSKERLHASLALLPADPAQVDYLFGQLVSANPDELPVIRDALADRKSELGERLWRLLGVPAEAAADSASPPASQPHVRHRLPVASVLAAYDPASERWAEVSGDVAQSLVSVSPVFLGRWMEHLRPVHGKLFAGLQAVLLDQAEARSESERHLAASILADFERDRCEVLADLVMSAREAQFQILDAALESHGDRAALVLNAELDERPSAGWSRAQKERLARRQASAAVALARLDPTDRIWALLEHRPDPRVRSWLIRRFAACGGDPRALAKQLAVEADVSARRGLILALGELPPDSLPADERSAMIQQLADLYERDPDPGIHAAADRLLRRWGQGERIARIEEALSEQAGRSESEVQGAERPRDGERGWYVNGQGHTMVVIPGPVDFAFGWRDADGSSVGQWPRVRIDRTYAIAAKRVTTAQYKGFFQETPELPHTYTKDLMDQPADLTLVSVNWYEAAQYCRWLSEKEGIPEDQMCYPPIPDMHEGMRLPDDYLQRTGYRLPTEAEWEYACRSGTQTMRYYGSAEELLGEYGWYRVNSNQEVQAVGLLKPNDFGLFDMLGNVRDWCQESYREDVVGTADRIDNVPDTSPLNNGVRRVIRGGAYWDGPAALTSFSRSAFWPSASGGGVGLRVARTLR